jgi:tetrapyrrole methylase family protein/MazG family protein
MIHIIGLGPGDPELITRKTWALITAAPEIWVRTRQHPAIQAVAQQTTLHSYDHLYQSHATFEAVYAAIATDVVARGQQGDVIYAVLGDPSVAEQTPQLIQKQARATGVPVTLHPAVSFLEPTFAALGQDPIAGLQIIDAQTLAAELHPRSAQGGNLLVPQLYSRLLAGDVKLTLMNAYPDEHPVTLISGAGTPALRLRTMPLYQLDRHDDLDDMTTLWVPAMSHAATYADLQAIIARLRAPDGCPWDRKQTHLSLRPYLLEETHEVLEALDAEDSEGLKEELGDLLIQVALHVQIATEAGEFKLADVIRHVVDKLVRRHPHVFGETSVQDEEDVIRNWEIIKQQERQEQGTTQKKKNLLDGLPASLPALSQAQTYVSRLSRIGYPLPNAAPLTEDDLGQRLLALVTEAQVADLDAESALRAAASQLRRGLEQLEAQAASQGSTLIDLPDDEQQALWRAWLKTR